MAAQPKNVDSYLATLPSDQRAALESLRRTIRAIVPKAEECITYRLPAFRLKGRILVAFGARANHCALYPMSSTVIGSLGDSVQGFETSKGTIRFQPARPLPAALVRKVVKARIAENDS